MELYLGLNDQGQKTLRFNGVFTPVKIVGNALLIIKQVRTASGHSILFSFNSKENFTLFYKLCEDIINQTDACSPANGYVEIVNRYNLWKKMFYGRKDILSEDEIQGLIAELLFLKNNIFDLYGTTAGLNSWSGPEPTHKDFSHGNDWFEVKSISNNKPTVFISSIEQLESNSDGKLVVFHMEKMSPEFNGYSLNPLVEEIMNSFAMDSDRDLFLDKLSQEFISDLIPLSIIEDKIKAEMKSEKLGKELNVEGEIVNLGGAYWRNLIAEGLRRKILSPMEIDLLNIAASIDTPRPRIASPKQAKLIWKIRKKLEDSGVLV